MKSCPSPFLMNCAAFTAWAIPYQITLYLALGFSPSLFASIAAIVAGSGAGFFGLFVREWTSDVIQVHPILTILYTSLVSGILLSLFSIYVFSISVLPEIFHLRIEQSTIAIVCSLFGLFWITPLTSASSIVSMVLCLFFPIRAEPVSRFG